MEIASKAEMRASGVHYFFAAQWPTWLWLTTFALGFSGRAVYLCWPLLISPTVWWQPLLALGCAFLAAVLGWFVGILVGWPVLGPIYYDRSLENGEPFQEGDRVQILVGPHRDRIVRVTSVFDFGYAGGHRICVDLGVAADGKNTFTSLEVLRIESAPSHSGKCA